MEDRTSVRFVFPHQLGWLRRPDLDQPHYHVWEKPSGEWVAIPVGRGLTMVPVRSGDTIIQAVASARSSVSTCSM